MLTWITNFAAQDNSDLADVVSVSYGVTEKAITQSHATQFSYESMKLGLRGVTIVASSGDNGVSLSLSLRLMRV